MKEAAPQADWFQKLRRPYIQAAVGIGIVLFFVIFGALFSLAGGELSERWGYQAAATGMLLYGVGNALLSLSADNVNRYWLISMACYVALVGVAVLIAWGYSGHWLTDDAAGSYKWIFIVLTFGYLVLLSIVSMMRNIVNFAEREEWTEPRRRD